MLLELEKNKKYLLARLKGELDHHSSENVRQRIDNCFLEKNFKNIILDLRDLTFMDSSGIGLIMGRYKKAVERQGRLLIISNNNNIERILTMSGLLKIIDLYPTLNMALENL